MLSNILNKTAVAGFLGLNEVLVNKRHIIHKMAVNIISLGIIIVFLGAGGTIILNILDIWLLLILFVAILQWFKNVSVFRSSYFYLVPTLLVRIIPITSSGDGTSNAQNMIADSTIGSWILSFITTNPIMLCVAVVGVGAAGYLGYKYWTWGGSSPTASTGSPNLQGENLTPEGPQKPILRDFEIAAREKAFQKVWNGPQSKVLAKRNTFQEAYNNTDVNLIIECSDPHPTSKLGYKFTKELKKFLGESTSDIYFKIRESVFKQYLQQKLNPNAAVDMPALQKHAVHVLSKDFPEINPGVDIENLESLFAMLELFILLHGN